VPHQLSRMDEPAAHLRTWRDGWRTLRFSCSLKARAGSFSYPGIALVVVGSLLGLWLLPGRERSRDYSDVHTMLYGATFVLVGFQSIAFAVFTSCLPISETCFLRSGCSTGFSATSPRGSWRWEHLSHSLPASCWRRHLGTHDSARSITATMRHHYSGGDLPTRVRNIFASFFLSVLGCSGDERPQSSPTRRRPSTRACASGEEGVLRRGKGGMAGAVSGR